MSSTLKIERSKIMPFARLRARISKTLSFMTPSQPVQVPPIPAWTPPPYTPKLHKFPGEILVRVVAIRPDQYKPSGWVDFQDESEDGESFTAGVNDLARFPFMKQGELVVITVNRIASVTDIKEHKQQEVAG